MKTLEDCGISMPEREAVWDDPSVSTRHAEAMEKVHALVSVRERCAKELRERLVRCGFSEQEAAEAVDAAQRCGLFSNERYASALIRGKTRAGWGREKILARLREMHISEATIELCAADFASPAEERARAMADLESHPSRSANPQASLMRRLVNKGYSFGLSREVVAEFLARPAGQASRF